MPRTRAETKSTLLCTRVTASIKDVITQQASREGLTASEWLRNLIVKELQARDVLPTVFKVPQIRVELREE
ncbi:MAG: hypothetical protein ACE5Z5_12855 [Candidatus Bathyarchaeia archaeon]